MSCLTWPPVFPNIVMAGLVPAIHVFGTVRLKTWMPESMGHLMPKMPYPGEDHGDAVVVGGFDHFVVAH